MVKFSTIFLCVFAFPIISFSQKSYRNAAHLELGGSGLYYSLNYERTFKERNLARLGFMSVNRDLVFPMLVGRYFGDGPGHLEVSLGVTYSVKGTVDGERTKQGQEVFGTGFIGYRYMAPARRFVFRIGYTPLISYKFSQWFGLSVGRRF